MKAIMISDKPKWCALMMNGEKTIEVRTSEALYKAIQKLIDKYGFADIYVYCSKSEYLLRTNKGYIATKKPLTVGKDTEYTFAYSDEGKVLFKFRCHKVDEFPYISDKYDKLIGSCLSEKELLDYSTIKFENGIRFVKTIYAIHISDLEIFDEPKELCEFYKSGFNEAQSDLAMDLLLEDDDCPYEHAFTKLEPQFRLTKAPQSWCYVEVE